ncbi:MAG: radical SAM protein [Ardenticatenaceae bacterium]|nr:radical SAM protein [Ardenticatenaceae bacterium]
MEIHAIPVEDKFIIYRPLMQTAFIGNAAMLEIIEQLAAGKQVTTSTDLHAFLDSIGFLRHDPPPPTAPSREFKPITAVLLVTNRCNLRCTYCYANAGVMPVADLSLELAQDAINIVYRNAVESNAPLFEVCFHGGGEPTQGWTLIKEATAYARRKELPCKITMVSNGIWSPTQREWMLENIDGVTISIDGMPETQNRQRPFANGSHTHTHIMKTLHALDQANIEYGIRMTATSPWGDTFAEDVRYLVENTHCPTFQVEPAFNTQRGAHQSSQQDEADAFIDGFMKGLLIAHNAGRSLIYSGARLGLITNSFCTAPYNALIINAAGQIVGCYEIASDSHDLGNVSIFGTLTDGQYQLYHTTRNTLLNHLDERRTTKCQSCFAQWHCAGDCYTRSTSVNNGQFHATSARCYTNRKLTKQLLLWLLEEGEGVWQGQQFEEKMVAI